MRKGMFFLKNPRRTTLNDLMVISLSLLLLIIGLTFFGQKSVYGIEFFTEDEPPFNVPYDKWVADYWNWEVSLSSEESTPAPEGCLMNNSSSLVMLKGPSGSGTPRQVCEISSDQAILIPLWVAWCDNTPGGRPRDPNIPLSKCAREEYNLGNIRSEVRVDGSPIADLNVRMSLMSGSLDYKKFSLENVTEIQTKNFDLIVPADTQMPNLPAGTWKAGSHGWWAILKPLPPGDHIISYSTRVTPTGALTSPGTNPHFSDITYFIKVG